MATKTRSGYATGTTTDSVEIQTASPGFSTMASPNKVSPSDCDNDQQPEMAMWPSKPEILISGTNGRSDDNSNSKLGVFDHAQLEEADPGRLGQRPTTGNGNIDVLLANHANSGRRSLSQSFS